jgi:hypothetical protein
MKTQGGVALILVLMITGALGLLMLQIGLSAKQHAAQAQSLLDRSEADLALHSANSVVLFELVTQPWAERPNSVVNTDERIGWNFSGEPFQLAGATVTIQDLSGLIPLPQPGQDVGAFYRILAAVGIDGSRAKSAVDGLSELQAAPEYVPLQHLSELRAIARLSESEIRSISQIATLFPVRVFNPSTAPVGALAARHSGSLRDGLIDLRSRGALGEQQYFGLVGDALDDSVIFYPGPGFTISTKIERGSTLAEEELTLAIDPYSSEPFSIWSRKRS